MFYSIKELVKQAQDYPSVAALMVATEAQNTGRSEPAIRSLMARNLDVMADSIAQALPGSSR